MAPPKHPIILALPRGGVPVGYQVAKIMGAPLDVLVVRKIGAPFNPEFGIGAVSEDGSYWIDSDSARLSGVTASEIKRLANVEFAEVTRRIKQYRRERPLPDLHGKTAIVVDDGIATGVTAQAACHYLKASGAEYVVLAVPVCSAQMADVFRNSGAVDELICLEEPKTLHSVGQFYQDFEQVSDEEVISLLNQAKHFTNVVPLRKNQSESMTISKEVTIKEGEISLPGLIHIPPAPQGLVLFAHGSGSSRLSPRNQQVADALAEAGFGTLLFDLLTEEESRDRSNVFDIPLLAGRLLLATTWLRNQKYGKYLPLGYFGASTGAAAALWAAAELKQEIAAVVSRGGRPDLAIPKLHSVTAPTLLIVGGNDEPVIEMNEEALKHLSNASLIIIPGATHLFEEPGTLEQVSHEASIWFLKHLVERLRREIA